MTTSEGSTGARFYTRARKIPKLVGRLHDGTRIPFGPYTSIQLISAGVVAVVLWQTRGLWATHGFVANVAIFVLPVAATLFLTRLVPLGGRNPLGWLGGVASVTGAPRAGRIEGQALGVRKAREVKHRVCVLDLPEQASK